MLYPQKNNYRYFIDLSGFWEFRFDPEDKGVEKIGKMVLMMNAQLLYLLVGMINSRKTEIF